MRKQWQKRFRSAQTAALWVLIILAELLISAIPAGIAAAILLPMGFKARGRFAIGGEWLLIALLYCVSYTAVHLWLCNKLFKEG